MSVSRPDPDALLDKIQREDARQQRGHLKIFFGACAGVGKTYAMLSAAHAQREQGVDVVVGIVETHGRQDTMKMLTGLEVLPQKQVSYKDKTLTEFDLDAAVERHPQLILVDELAHSNVTGSRHAKRWQDVEELLIAGINVHTTVNVQHLETLNDVVGQITGIRVWETVPDKVFDMANEITLVDLPPDELLRRLKEGKVYFEQQAQRAAKNFFRKGNLIALRELALRRTADQVDVEMRDYRADQSIHQVWQAKERLLVCVGPDASATKLIRGAARLAASLRADWIAVYVETPALHQLSTERREMMRRAMQLASELGGETTSLAGENIPDLLLSYARSRNVSRLVIGRSRRPTWLRLFRRSLADELANRTTDMDVVMVGHDAEQSTATENRGPASSHIALEENAFKPSIAYLWTCAVCFSVTLASAGLLQFFDLANVVMLYLLGVVIVAIRFGRGPSILASFLSVASFDYFFVPPRFSFSVSDSQYLFTFMILLAVSLIISNLMSNLRFQARIAHYRERRADALYTMSKSLSGALMVEQIIEISVDHLAPVFQAHVAVLLPDSHEKIRQPLSGDPRPGQLTEMDTSVAQWVYEHHQPAGLGTNTLPSNAVLYLPLRAPMRTRGVLAIAPNEGSQLFQPEQQQLLETFAAQIALALERVHYVEVAQDALINMEAERLRNSLLSAISHDLRTPLTAIVGLASTLHEKNDLSIDKRHELSLAIHDEALRMSGLVMNLLDMARLQSGKVNLNRQWQPLEEVVGSALRASAHALQGHQLMTQIPSDLPLLSFDAVLLERVLCNLLENAAKYGKNKIDISAEHIAGQVYLHISDDGPGIPAGINIFEKFTRGDVEAASPGVGLGLAICENIMHAHGGNVTAENLPEGGARLTISLPVGDAPALPALTENELQ
ncbi:sensor histidine kinase KdpD [Undibacterium oligocarboniphilum]|uniref:histidine kinase n=2 Tax=Undibacterium oligocarboniphilum TaxID=666702 RepID=A0A850QM78_9BURK|nr:sensor histidine kinase KdpD [Undibacterium oligocarboniphilum]NVO78493.1 sensor histidine kinase KdpD [Undibacterium oligocarboniphilum]